MDFLVATENGLFQVTDTGAATLLVDGGFQHVVVADEGSVALSSDRTLWNVDDNGTVAEFDELATLAGTEPTCLVLDEDDVWIGTGGAHLVVIREGEHRRIGSFDAVEGRDAWYTPGGEPPAVRSLDIDDDGVLFANVHVGGVLRSLDRGETWTQTMDIHWDAHQVCTVPEYAKTVVAATSRGLALSTDAGESWELEAAGLHAAYARAVAVAGDHVVLSVSDGPQGTRSALYRRLLDNTEFIRCTSGLPDFFAGNVDTHCLAALDELVIAGVPGGVLYQSTDTGLSWKPAVSNLPEIRAVAII